MPVSGGPHQDPPFCFLLIFIFFIASSFPTLPFLLLSPFFYSLSFLPLSFILLPDRLYCTDDYCPTLEQLAHRFHPSQISQLVFCDMAVFMGNTTWIASKMTKSFSPFHPLVLPPYRSRGGVVFSSIFDMYFFAYSLMVLFTCLFCS